jgi:hypothetical protein
MILGFERFSLRIRDIEKNCLLIKENSTCLYVLKRMVCGPNISIFGLI